jgi:hypothetical protein
MRRYLTVVVEARSPPRPRTVLAAATATVMKGLGGQPSGLICLGSDPDGLASCWLSATALAVLLGVRGGCQPPVTGNPSDGQRWGHCCIEAKGVLAVPQSEEKWLLGTVENRNKPVI